MIGQTIAQYRIIRELGRGAMGVVYLAEHVVLGRRVAIKTVSSNYGRFLREARAASALSHPHIATIHDYGKTDSGQPYIVMEYIEGKTLADLILQGNLTIARSLRIVREVAEALSEAHRHNIIHRDIKPTNIAVDDRGIVKVLDFGLAKQVGLETEEPDNNHDANSLNTRTREGVLVGTPMYFSPEQAMGLELDPRSDLFSLGLVLYECLCGKPAFSGVTPMDICAKVIRDEPVAPSQINPSISTDVERVTLRALEKEKDKRYQSATDLASDLETLELSFSSAGRLSIDQIQGPPKEKPVVIDRGRKIKRLALVLLGVLIIGLISAWWLFSSQRQRPKPEPPVPEQVRLGIGGNIIEAAISPDGEFVAYVNDENGKQSIRSHQFRTGSDIQVVNPGNAKYKGLSFFPNSIYLSYLKTEGDTADLYQVATIGGASRKLASNVDTPVSFSPDGGRFTFVRYSAAEHLTTLLIADANGSNEQTLATLKEPQRFSRGGFYSSGPAWSPDGKIIAVPAFSVSDETYREIILVNVSDSGMNTVTMGRWNVIEKIVWLADGSGFLMNAIEVKSSLFQVWLVDRQGGEARNITKNPSDYIGLSATKDSQVVLTTQNERTSSVWIQPASVEQIPSSRRLGSFGISWTADGKFVLASNIDGNYQIYTMDADGSNRKQVIFNDQTNFEPVTSPDGRYIVYASYEGRHPHIWRADIDGNHAKQLTFGADEDLPRFTPDGKWIVYHNIDHNRYSIRKVSIDGGDPITVVSEHSTQPDVSPDGTRVACFAQRAGTTTWEILVVPIDGGAPVARFPLPPTVNSEWPGLRWSPDGDGLTYVATVQGVSNVWRQALSGGEAKPLTKFKENRIFFFDWSRERKLVLVRGSDTRDLILVRNFLDANK
jgi:serine/threonine protein kinase